MATRAFTDQGPTSWTLRNGRHNSLSRHRGMHGLWYLVETIGQGRYKDHWALMVFPDSVRTSGYAGDYRDRVVTIALMERCLLRIEGRGGYDYGKGVSSKGGYREGGPIAYTYGTHQFDGQLLDDGDEFLRQVLGYEPTIIGITQGIDRDKRRRQEEIQRRQEVQALHDAQYAVETAQREASRSRYEALFAEVVIPEGVASRITSNGLEVWRDHGEHMGHMRIYDQTTLTDLPAYLAWYRAMMEKLAEEEVLRERQKAAQIQRDAKQAAQDDQREREIAAIAGELDGLEDLLSNL
ncbi:hypothetical protein HGA91_02050 [candidate division WWE3 bacterium]|nr:hypothetical protein [candidate division WWE3 bacterium]